MIFKYSHNISQRIQVFNEFNSTVPLHKDSSCPWWCASSCTCLWRVTTSLFQDFYRQWRIAPGTWQHGNSTLLCPTLAANSLFLDSRKFFVRLSLLIVLLEGQQQDDQQTQPHEQLPGTQGQYCVTRNFLCYMIDLCNDTVFMTFMYVYNLIALSCYFSDFVVIFMISMYAYYIFVLFLKIRNI